MTCDIKKKYLLNAVLPNAFQPFPKSIQKGHPAAMLSSRESYLLNCYYLSVV